MCFSEGASYAAGAVLTGAGAYTLQRADRACAPLAAVPLMFGLQQLTEGLVWRAVEANPAGETVRSTPGIALAYLMFAYVLWPVIMPIAVARIEPRPGRRRAMAMLAVLGGGVGAWLLGSLLREPPRVHVARHHLDYGVTLSGDALVIASYLTAVCASCLLSSWPLLRLLGAASAVSAGITALVAIEAFASIWCFCAAVLSLIVFLHVRNPVRAAGVGSRA